MSSREKHFIVAGVTGGVASGKSSLCRMLVSRGAAFIDADQVSRRVTRRGSPVLKSLVERYGKEILLESGELDRRALARAAFSSREGARDLNRITHPPILRSIREELEGMAGSGYHGVVVIEAALIVEEASSRNMFDLIVAVVCSDGTRRRRLAREGERAAAIMTKMSRSQLPDERKAAAADYVVRNEGSIGELEAAADRLWRWLMERKASAGRREAGRSE